MKKIIASISLLFLSCSFPVHSADPFADFDEEMNEYEAPDHDKLIEQYLLFVNEYLTEYNAWRKEYLHDFDKKQEKIINRWGETTTQKISDVSYSEDLSSREIIDYDNNEVVIEILVPVTSSTAENEQILVNHLATSNNKNELIAAQSQQPINSSNIETHPITLDPEAAKKAIKQQTTAYQKEADMAADKLQETQQIPEEIIEYSVNSSKEALQKEEQQRIAKLEAQYAQLQKEQPTHKVLKYTVKLPKNSLSKRAQKYTALAEQESKEFEIPAALIMAIMHSESDFDPNAKSGIPAYGLMQIVPRTAGHDVNRIVRKIDKPMQPNELYDIDINVETGSAYLSILNTRYLKAIKDPQSRMYCTIAAYNTGTGNVAKVFNTSGNLRNMNKAAKTINQMTADEVYDALITRLPYVETKNYLKKVSKRIALYEVKAEI